MKKPTQVQSVRPLIDHAHEAEVGVGYVQHHLGRIALATTDAERDDAERALRQCQENVDRHLLLAAKQGKRRAA